MGKRILVVEDNPDTVETIRFILEKRGFEMITAADGEQGLQKAREHKPDLIMLDLKLPKIEGDDVAFELSQHSDTADIPIVFLTIVPAVASQRLEQKSRVLQQEIKKKVVLSKSCPREELSAVINKLLNL